MKYKWWEYPIAAVTAPFILGILVYIDWENRQWTKRRLQEQERWAAGDHTPWQR